jgi:hypothetical protein
MNIDEAIEAVMKANPIKTPVNGSPFQPGDRVEVVAAIDKDVKDLSHLVGWWGQVEYLEYECGCGQTYPGDPMIGVRFAGNDNLLEEFWKEELFKRGV